MRNKIIGRYKLLSHGTFSLEGVFASTSQFMRGELQYSSEGFLSVLILWSPKVEKAADIFAYSGKFELIDDRTVKHIMHVSTVDRFNDGQEVRTIFFEGELIVLGKVFADGTRFEAKWQRITS